MTFKDLVEKIYEIIPEAHFEEYPDGEIYIDTRLKMLRESSNGLFWDHELISVKKDNKT
jgi:hypothetical protein